MIRTLYAVVCCWHCPEAFCRCPAARASLSPCVPTTACSETGAPLTIDVHARVFNGSDLQIREFLARTALDDDSELKGVAQAVGSLLQTIAWNAAPDVREETKYIEHLLQARRQLCRQCSVAPSRRSRVPGRLCAPSARAAGCSAADTRAARVAAVLSPDRTSPGLGAAINALPETLDEFEQQSRGEVSVLGSQPHLKGYLQFVLHHFYHRHVNALDYLSTYSPGSKRKIDLLVPSMVDYDWWLALGRPTRTPLSEQVDLMSRISVLTGGRVHGFAPFCPFRELMTARGDSPGESMSLVQRAIQSGGFIGVKLYPPMGFAPLGNSALDVWKGKPKLPAAANETGFGLRLDTAMRRLFTWCRENDVPVMAHANHSNGPNEQFKSLAGSGTGSGRSMPSRVSRSASGTSEIPTRKIMPANVPGRICS